MKRIRWGVIGAGGIADRRTILQGILPSKLSELTMLMDVKKKTVGALSKKYCVEGTTDIDKLLSSDNVDAVYIATPHHLHAEQIAAAARAGKHVLSEKPMARDTKEARKVAAAIKRAGITFSLAFLFRYHACHVKIKRLIHEGAIGRPVAGRAQLSCWYPKMKDSWRQIPEKGFGGTVPDMASHVMDLLEFFLGKTTELCAFVSTLVHGYPADDMCTVIHKFESGAHGIVDVYWNVPDRACENRLEIYGDKGSITAAMTLGQEPYGEFCLVQSDQGIYDAGQTMRNRPPKRRLYRPRPASTYMAEVNAFARAILENKQGDFPTEQAIWNLRLCESVYRSARTGRVVSL